MSALTSLPVLLLAPLPPLLLLLVAGASPRSAASLSALALALAFLPGNVSGPLGFDLRRLIGCPGLGFFMPLGNGLPG